MHMCFYPNLVSSAFYAIPINMLDGKSLYTDCEKPIKDSKTHSNDKELAADF